MQLAVLLNHHMTPCLLKRGSTTCTHCCTVAVFLLRVFKCGILLTSQPNMSGQMLGQCVSSTHTNCLKFHQGPKLCRHSDRRKVECPYIHFTLHLVLGTAYNYTWLRLDTVPYLFDLKRPSKYATPSIFSNFLISKNSDCSVYNFFYVAS